MTPASQSDYGRPDHIQLYKPWITNTLLMIVDHLYHIKIKIGHIVNTKYLKLKTNDAL